jgi:hypothetical protein
MSIRTLLLCLIAGFTFACGDGAEASKPNAATQTMKSRNKAGAEATAGAGGADAGRSSNDAGRDGVRADVAGLACFDGNHRYPANKLKSTECTQCAVANCCEEWVECQKDPDCTCHLRCVSEGSSSDRCLQLCRISRDPVSDRWSECLLKNCERSCALTPKPAPESDAGPRGGNPNSESCRSDTDCASDNCLDTGNGLQCFGTARGDGKCETEFDCYNGLCLPLTPDGDEKVCVEADFACVGAGVDACHLKLAIQFCQLHKKCTTVPESFDGCIARECIELTSKVSASECDGVSETLENDPSCP